MNTSLSLLVSVVQVISALVIVGLVLLQHGKGADMGASFGSGASATVFGSQGSSTFLSRVTAILATAFFMTSLGLAFFAKEKSDNLMQAGLPDPAVLEVQENKPVSDVPVLEEQKSAVEKTDVPQAPEQK